jgi:hypothetical protein
LALGIGAERERERVDRVGLERHAPQPRARRDPRRDLERCEALDPLDPPADALHGVGKGEVDRRGGLARCATAAHSAQRLKRDEDTGCVIGKG